MAAIRDRLATTVGRALRDMPPQRRLHVAAMLAIFALYLGHLLLWCWPQPFFIEDAAITFAYARNWISGDLYWPKLKRALGFWS